MMRKNKIATVFGGTGFIGRHVVRELAARGVVVKVATRVPESAYFLRPCGNVGQVVPFACDYGDEQSIARAVENSDYVVNCIGTLYEKGRRRTFKKTHIEIPAMIAAASKKAGAQRLVHISALACARGSSKYAKSKLEGEKAVLKRFKGAVILRPSVVFGENDDFFNMFAKLSRISPVLPLIGGGKTKFQPVFVGDVADAVIAGLEKVSVEDKNAQDKIYELGGPDILTFKEVYETVFEYTQRPRRLVYLPFWAAKVEAFFLQILPRPLLSVDQVESLKTDNVVSEGASGLEDLGIVSKSMNLILPHYLESYRSGGRFGDKMSA